MPLWVVPGVMHHKLGERHRGAHPGCTPTEGCSGWRRMSCATAVALLTGANRPPPRGGSKCWVVGAPLPLLPGLARPLGRLGATVGARPPIPAAKVALHPVPLPGLRPGGRAGGAWGWLSTGAASRNSGPLRAAGLPGSRRGTRWLLRPRSKPALGNSGWPMRPSRRSRTTTSSGPLEHPLG